MSIARLFRTLNQSCHVWRVTSVFLNDACSHVTINHFKRSLSPLLMEWDGVELTQERRADDRKGPAITCTIGDRNLPAGNDEKEARSSFYIIRQAIENKWSRLSSSGNMSYHPVTKWSMKHEPNRTINRIIKKQNKNNAMWFGGGSMVSNIS